MLNNVSLEIENVNILEYKLKINKENHLTLKYQCYSYVVPKNKMKLTKWRSERIEKLKSKNDYVTVIYELGCYGKVKLIIESLIWFTFLMGIASTKQ